MARDFEILNQKPKGRDPKEEISTNKLLNIENKSKKEQVKIRMSIIEDEMTTIRIAQLNIDKQLHEINILNK